MTTTKSCCFLIKSPEEGQFVRPKYRKTSSRFCLCCLFITIHNFTVYIFTLNIIVKGLKPGVISKVG